MFVFLAVFFLYVLTLCPTIYVGDSPLFAAASYSLGTAHPPGYPLYILLGKLGTFLPLGNIAFKVNLINATFGGLSAFMTYKVVYYLTNNKYAAWAAALFLAVVPTFWTGAINAKGVYSLNTFLCLVILLLVVRMLKSDGSLFQQSMLAAFLIGLGMGNHHTIVLMGLSAIPVFFMRWRDFRIRWIPLLVIFVFAGFSVNLFIYIRSRVAVTSGINFLYSYGGTFETLKAVFLRKAYSTDTITTLKGGTTKVLPDFFAVTASVIRNILIPNVKYGTPFILLGLFSSFRDRKLFIYVASLLFFWITFMGSVTVGMNPTEEDVQVASVYYAPLYAFMSVLLGLGVALTLSKAASLWKGSRLIPGFLASAVIAFPLCLIPQVVFPTHVLAYVFAKDMLTVLPVKSMLLHYNDNPTFTSFYMQAVERYREDILVMNAGGRKDNYGIETAPSWKYAVFYPEFYRGPKVKVSYLDREFASRGKLFTSNPKDLTDVIKNHYSYKLYVLTARLYPKGTTQDDEKMDRQFLNAYDLIDTEQIRGLPWINDFLATELVNHYALAMLLYGEIMDRHGYDEIGQKAMNESFVLADPKSFLGPYVKFLHENGRTEEALLFLRKLEQGPSGRDSAIAYVLEYKLLSVMGRTEEAASKYRYIREHDLMRIINARF